MDPGNKDEFIMLADERIGMNSKQGLWFPPPEGSVLA